MPSHETGLADIGNPTVDDDARVQHPVVLARRRRAEERAETGRFEPVALTRSQHEAKVGKRHQHEHSCKGHPAVGHIRPVEGELGRAGHRQAQDAAYEGRGEMAEGGGLECRLDGHQQAANH